MDTRFLQVPGQDVLDKYTASIELSNACRQFYQSRVEAANCIRSRWEQHAPCTRKNDNDRSHKDVGDNKNSSRTNKAQRNSIDVAMETLRTEMASLMEQDLSLMKQLLTLNETIEELKWQRRYYYSRSSVPDSSQSIQRSDWSVSDTEMYETDDDLPLTTTTTTTTDNTEFTDLTPRTSSQTPIALSRWRHGAVSNVGHQTELQESSKRFADTQVIVKGSKRCVDTQVIVNGSSLKVYHGEQNSFDSGIHEHSYEEEVSV